MSMERASARSTGTPCLVVICGPPCSGKSTVARELATTLARSGAGPFALLEMDEIRLATTPHSHTAEDRARAYGRMHELAALRLDSGARGVVLVATYQPAQQRRAVRQLADQLSARLLIFECQVDANEAVKRFSERSRTHAGIDLSAERVWDLAHDFPYVWNVEPDSQSLRTVWQIDTDKVATKEAATEIARKVAWSAPAVPGGPSVWLDRWVESGNPAGPPEGHSELHPPGHKLTELSRTRARWRILFGWVIFAATSVAAAVTLVVLLKALTDVVAPGARLKGIPGDPGEWIQSWAAIAALAAGVWAAYEYFLRSHESTVARQVRDAGTVPRLDLREARPSNREVFRRYKRRVRRDDEEGFLIEGVPLWFVIPPVTGGGEIEVVARDRVALDESELQRRAAKVGLDWHGYVAWRTARLEERYRERHRESGFRALKLERQENRLRLEVCQADYFSYLCTELSANLMVDGRSGFEIRQILEGDGWIQSDPPAGSRRLGALNDLVQAGRTHELLVGVQVALTTRDGYLILQRRSDRVQANLGGLAASGAGSAQWADFKVAGADALVRAAIRETCEEIGWLPDERDDLSRPFIGAAFSLLRGRDLNFYCHFATQRTLHEVARTASSRGWWRDRRRAGSTSERARRMLTRIRPSASAWEVAHLVPVPLEAIRPGGKLSEPFDALLADSRHVQGLLFCLDQSTRLRNTPWDGGRHARLDGRDESPGRPGGAEAVKSANTRGGR